MNENRSEKKYEKWEREREKMNGVVNEETCYFVALLCFYMT